MLSTLGSLNGSILANPRVFYALSRDGLFFRSLAAVHPRFETPHAALLLYMVLGVAGVATQTFEQLASIFVLGIWPFYALAVAAVFVLRPERVGPDAPQARWGSPILSLSFLIVSAAMLVNGVIHRPLESTISLGVLLLGVPAYYGWIAFKRRGQSA
jgi:APA family basic amino acid/polyamine antiporter